MSTIDEVLAEVGDDAARAQDALEAELASDAPRKTLVSRLQDILGAQPEAEAVVEPESSDEVFVSSWKPKAQQRLNLVSAVERAQRALEQYDAHVARTSSVVG